MLHRLENKDIQRYVSELIYEGIRTELSNCKKLEGESYKKFCDTFGIEKEYLIFFNSVNVVFTDKEVLSIIGSYLPEKNLIMRVDIPSLNTFVIVYQIFDVPVFSHIFETDSL